MPPRSISEHVESILTQVEHTDTNLAALEIKVSTASSAATSAAKVAADCAATLAGWINVYGTDLGALVQLWL